VNEVNTIPASHHQHVPRKCGKLGVSQKQLIARLIELAIERRADRRKLKTQI